MLSFIHELAKTGRVQVTPAPDDDLAPSSLAAAVRAVDRAARREMPGDAPPLSVPTAVWAARTLEAGCRFLVYRAYDEPAIDAALTAPCPESPNPSTCHSADLFLRHLPDLFRLARGLATDDPLLAYLTGLGRRWPLSSVGVPTLSDEAFDVRPFAADPTLVRVYVDRIVRHGDAGRLRPTVVRDAARLALGDHAADLAPALAAALVRPHD